MKFTIFFLGAGVILLSAGVLFDVNYVNYSDPVPYSQWQKINFYSFKALKRPGMKLNGVAEFAYIKTNRKVDFLENGDIEITAYFHPSRSYVFAKDIRNPDLLKHELYHLHITEYCTRLLRQEIIENKNNPVRDKINDLNKKYYRLENKMQSQYDEDSYHSYILGEQKKWEIKVDSLLNSLQAFSDPLIHMAGKE